MGRARPPRCPDAAGAAMRTPEYTLDEAAEVLPDELAVDLPARRPARTTARTGAATVTTLRRKPADWRSRRTA